MKLKYAFHLGRVFTLSLAELFAVFEAMALRFRLLDYYREVLVIETEDELDALALQKSVGGTIKIMQVLDSVGRKKDQGPSRIFYDYFDTKILKEKYLTSLSGKIQIGISLYPLAEQLPLRGEGKHIGLRIKEILSGAGHSVRIVFPQNEGLALPSVVVTHEHLLEKGGELDFLVGQERIYISKTLTVQDFEDYGRRDYQRPARDMQIGMLPPKVAQVMINLAGIPLSAKGELKTAILDPFVGSGTIIQEAMILGYKGVGTDVSEKSIEQAEKNLLWIKNRYKLPPGRFETLVSDVKDLAGQLPKYNYLAVVTEGTLGPGYVKEPDDREIQKNYSSLESIYLNAFSALHKILPKEKRVVIALPAYRKRNGYVFFQIIDKVLKLGYDIVTPLPEIILERYPYLEVTKRLSIIYDRKNAFVSREIFIFKKV